MSHRAYFEGLNYNSCQLLFKATVNNTYNKFLCMIPDTHKIIYLTY
jgi:hypothetical protein